jgi:hypothetical protein
MASEKVTGLGKCGLRDGVRPLRYNASVWEEGPMAATRHFQRIIAADSYPHPLVMPSSNGGPAAFHWCGVYP